MTFLVMMRNSQCLQLLLPGRCPLILQAGPAGRLKAVHASELSNGMKMTEVSSLVELQAVKARKDTLLRVSNCW